jgi:hypothetical protein
VLRVTSVDGPERQLKTGQDIRKEVISDVYVGVLQSSIAILHTAISVHIKRFKKKETF